MKNRRLVLILSCLSGFLANAKVSTPSIFGSNMVLQRNQSCPIWGWADPNSPVILSFAGKVYQTKANRTGDWKILLDPEEASAKPRKMVISDGFVSGFEVVRKNLSKLLEKHPDSLVYENVLVGEVWLCSGQSNMQWNVSSSDDSDLESLSAKRSDLRFISIPQVGTQTPQSDFNGQWESASPSSASSFSAVGYFFGRRLQQILGVPVGLIDNSWGGSACEAWIPRQVLEAHPIGNPYHREWSQLEKDYDFELLMNEYRGKLAQWEKDKKEGKTGENRPRPPRNKLEGQHRPGNLYNGVLHPVIGFGIKGVIWYQGESNAERAYAYREIFPLMIQSWRQAWGQGDFPFYWCQLADFKKEVAQPMDSAWAELRESQTLTLEKMNKVGEAVIVDAGEGRDIHPRNKQVVANRLLRHALVKDYDFSLPCESPRYASMEIMDGKIILRFDHTGSGLYCFDENVPKGFSVCGDDRKFVWAEAKLIGKDKIEVWAESIPSPIAVRYAWADNPVCNLYRKDGSVTLPVTPFRTDDFPLTTTGK